MTAREFVNRILSSESEKAFMKDEAVSLFVDMLLEDKATDTINKMKKVHAKMNVKHDPQAAKFKPSTVIRYWAKIDPSEDKSYLPTILNWYKKGQFTLADSPKVSQALHDFHKHRDKMPQSQQRIGNADAYTGLDDVVHAVKAHKTLAADTRALSRNAPLIHSSPELDIRKVNTHSAMAVITKAHEASGHIGWCVKDKETWDQYQRDYPGIELYTFHDKTVDPKTRKDKFLWDTHTSQFNHAGNMPADSVEFAKKFPIVNTLLHMKGKEMRWVDPVRLKGDLDKISKVSSIEDPELHNRMGNLAQSSVDPKVLTKLAPYVPHAVVNNRYTPTAALDKIDFEKDYPNNPNVNRDRAYNDFHSFPDEGKNIELSTSLARHANTSSAMLDKLGTHPNIGVQRYVARHGNTSIDTTNRLAGSSDERTAMYAAQKIGALPHAYPADTLDKLVNHTSSSVVSGLTTTKSPELLGRLVDASWKKSNFPIVGSGFLNVLGQVAENKATPTEHVDKLAGHSNENIAAIAVDNPHISDAGLESAFNNPSGYVVRRALNNRYDQYGRSHATAEDMDKLAGHQNLAIRRYASDHPVTPSSALAKLADDPDIAIARNVAIHNSTPPETLTKLSGHGDMGVKLNVARNVMTPPEVLDKLADHPSDPGYDTYSKVVMRVASNPNTSHETFRKLYRHPHADIVDQAINTHPPEQPEDLEHLSTHTNANVRSGVYYSRHATPALKATMRKTQMADVDAGREYQHNKYDSADYTNDQRRAGMESLTNKFINRLLA